MSWWSNPHYDDPYRFEPQCACCDDMGCVECCEVSPPTSEDMDGTDAEIAASEGRS